MKAIIMAGGEGTRLRPLTCTMPKPMARILGRPAMEHIIILLRNHGIRDIGVTLMYMPEKIREYFGDGTEWGVHLTYFQEETPLGTAGSVKNAAEFFTEDFLVISGDAITGADLTAFLAFHREKGAEATLLLKPMDVPLEYGVVVTDEEGRITRFLEKPSWSRVFSDTVNTGIYLLNPSVLTLCEKMPCDFSKDIFPRLLSEGRKLFGYVSTAYWCDIGDLDAYRHCHYDLFSSSFLGEIGVCRLGDGIYAEEGAVIEEGAKVLPPVFLGRGAHIKSGARIDGYTVLGEGTVVESGASLKRSVLYDHVTVGKNAEVRGSILLSRTTLGENTAMFEQTVLGEDSRIGDGTVVKPGVKIWPGKAVGKEQVLSQNLVWGASSACDLCTARGLSGQIGSMLTPGAALSFGGAVGTVIGKHIGIGTDGSPEGEMLKASALGGLLSAGCEVTDFGTMTLPMLRSAVKAYGMDGAVFAAHTEGTGRLEVLSAGGLSPDENTVRKLQTAFYREEFAHEGMVSPLRRIGEYKLRYLKRLISGAEKCTGLSVAVASASAFSGDLLYAASSQMGFTLYLDEAEVLSPSAPSLRRFAESVPARGCAFGATMDPLGEKIILIDERGRILGEDLYKTLAALLTMKTYKNPRIYAASGTPDAVDILAGRYGASVIRTRENSAAFMQALSGPEGESQFLLHFDAVGAIITILSCLAREKKSLSKILDEIPAFSMEKREVRCREKDKGRIIRHFLSESRGENDEGVKIFEKNGWVLILPEEEKPACKIIAYAEKEEYARELTDFYDGKIHRLLADNDS